MHSLDIRYKHAKKNQETYKQSIISKFILRLNESRLRRNLWCDHHARSIPSRDWGELFVTPKDRVKSVAACTCGGYKNRLNYSLTIYDERYTYSVNMRANGNESIDLS